MINKLKKLFGMNKEKNVEVETAPPEGYDGALDENFDGREEIIDQYADDPNLEVQMNQDEAVADVDSVPDPESGDEDVDEGLEKDPEPTNPEDIDAGYLENGVEILGFQNREEQFGIYEQISQYIEGSKSILDFGAGRGDLYTWWTNVKEEVPNYLGIEMNGPLVEAGRKVNGNVELEHIDWFDLKDATFREWSINVNSFTSRSDANIAADDMKYAKDTIRKMYQHCTEGCVIILPDTLRGDYPENYMNLSPGALLEFILSEISPAVAVDHAYAYDLYTIIIYKTKA